MPLAPDGAGNDLSAWRLNTWSTCPLKYKFKYIDGLAAPPAAGEFVRKMVYGLLEHYYRRKQAGEPLSAVDLAQHLRERWHGAALASGVRFASAAEEQGARQQTLGLLAAYVSRVPPDEPRPLEVKRRLEAPLIDPTTGEDSGLRLVGIIDLLLPEANGPLIVEFKVTAQNRQRLEVAHEIQFACTAYLLRHAYQGMAETGFEVCQLVKTKTPQVVWGRYAAREEVHFRRLFAMIRAYLDDLDAKRLIFRPGEACSYC
ncbi:MAG TPA: PD-(D/E)XK nuclease family protein, partial [Pirellulales bacterium]|nr:PD-(D/E)XK nuclease family protein [Pirellulales bacterium]